MDGRITDYNSVSLKIQLLQDLSVPQSKSEPFQQSILSNTCILSLTRTPPVHVSSFCNITLTVNRFSDWKQVNSYPNDEKTLSYIVVNAVKQIVKLFHILLSSLLLLFILVEKGTIFLEINPRKFCCLSFFHFWRHFESSIIHNLSQN